jgi:hypothetical protein
LETEGFCDRLAGRRNGPSQAVIACRFGTDTGKWIPTFFGGRRRARHHGLRRCFFPCRRAAVGDRFATTVGRNRLRKKTGWRRIGRCRKLVVGDGIRARATPGIE